MICPWNINFFYLNPYLIFCGLLPTLSSHGDILLSPCSAPYLFASMAIHLSLPVRCRTKQIYMLREFATAQLKTVAFEKRLTNVFL